MGLGVGYNMAILVHLACCTNSFNVVNSKAFRQKIVFYFNIQEL